MLETQPGHEHTTVLWQEFDPEIVRFHSQAIFPTWFYVFVLKFQSYNDHPGAQVFFHTQLLIPIPKVTSLHTEVKSVGRMMINNCLFFQRIKLSYPLTNTLIKAQSCLLELKTVLWKHRVYNDLPFLCVCLIKSMYSSHYLVLNHSA